MASANKMKKAIVGPGYLNAWAAGVIDRIYLTETKGLLATIWKGFKLRFMFTFFFLPLTFVDMLVSGFMGVLNAFGAFFSSDHTQERRIHSMKNYSTLFSKNFFALLAAPLGYFFPKLIVFYFTPKRISKSGIDAGGNLYHSEATIVKPKDNEKTTALQQLSAVIQNARDNNYKIMPVGAGRSQGKQFFPKRKGEEPGVVVDLKHMNAIAIDPATKVATVGAGTRWVDLQAAANKHKLALQVMQASNIFSVGGSIGTNIHGWDHQAGMLSNTVIEMTVMDGNGLLHVITPNDERFHRITGGLGMFGIVVQAKIQLTDNELLKEVSDPVPLTDYTAYYYNQINNNPNIKMHLFRLSLKPGALLQEGVAVSYMKVDHSLPVVTPDFSPENPIGTRMDRILINVARRIPWLRKNYWQTESKRLLANHSALQSRNEIMRPPINAMFSPSVSEAEWLQEYFLPAAELNGFLQELSTILNENNVVLLNASVRIVKHNPHPILSYAPTEDRFAVVLCWNQSLKPDELVKAQKWLRLAQEKSVEFKGTYYLPYQHVTSPEVFHAAYPQAKAVSKLKHEDQTAKVFKSELYSAYIKTQKPTRNYFKEIMSTEASRAKFAGFLEVVLQRVDTKPFFALLADVISYKDTHAAIYTELCRRLSEITPSTLGTLRRTLHSLATIKHDLLAQAKTLLPENMPIDGLVEIGYPGRFIKDFKNNFDVTGTIAAVFEGPSATDFIQSGIPRPYNKFVKLDYANPTLGDLADNSAEVITCYVGLHHFTDEQPNSQLDAFLRDVRRVLKPAGTFLLVDHDIDNDETMAMAHMAHMIFNAVTGVSTQEEMREVRNFQPMSYWRERLAAHDLGYAVMDPDVPLIRDGDPSRNRMMSFVKPPEPRAVLTAPAVPIAQRIAQSWRTNSLQTSSIAAAAVAGTLYRPAVIAREQSDRGDPEKYKM